MSYSPKYVPFDEIPIQIPDDYSDKEKEAALEFAEATIELDLNEGQDIPGQALNNLGTYIRAAIKQKATCELAKGAEHPDDVSLSDLSSTGADKATYAADAFCDRYDEIADKLMDSGVFGDDGPGDTSPFTFTTDNPTPRDEYQTDPVEEDRFNRYN
jgi:hypothetical protein